MTGEPVLRSVRGRVPDWTQYLAVDADLEVEVATAAGERAAGRLTGQGHRLRLDLDRPEILAETTNRSTVTAVTAQLAAAHLRCELHGPRGRIAVFDPARTNRISALLIGSPHVSVDRPGWALAARTVAPTAIAAAGLGAAVLVGVAAIVRRRRS